MSSASNRSTTPPAAANAGDEPSFEQALDQLEGIVHQLEDGDLDLAAALQQYEAGVKHLRRCFTLLEQAERKIELLTGIDAQGVAITEPFDDERATLEEQAGRRRKTTPARRTPAAKPPTGDVDDSDAVF